MINAASASNTPNDPTSVTSDAMLSIILFQFNLIY